jgi:predicted AAA+ superfamily ATPase
MGKSSLVKAVVKAVNQKTPHALALIEIARDEIKSLACLMETLAREERRFVLFCDDLSFEQEDQSYKALKTLLDGGLRGGLPNVILYATSNRRHLIPRDMLENERGAAIHPSEAAEEKISLSDRFGLWLGFHSCPQELYLNIVAEYARHFAIGLPEEELRAGALAWAMTRGSRSGRVAWQFIQTVRDDQT